MDISNDMTRRQNMSTITIDTALYENASSYARRHSTSIRRIVEDYISRLVHGEPPVSTASKAEYYISPSVRKLEAGFKVPQGLSTDYKKETAERIDRKYL